MDELRSYGVTTAEALAGVHDASAAFARWQDRWTPEAIAARKAETAAKQRAERQQQRDAAAPTDLTLEALLDKLGFSPEYAEHLMQPYCHCGDGHDGWDYCAHARDLGWPERDWTRQ